MESRLGSRTGTFQKLRTIEIVRLRNPFGEWGGKRSSRFRLLGLIGRTPKRRCRSRKTTDLLRDDRKRESEDIQHQDGGKTTEGKRGREGMKMFGRSFSH